MRDANAIVLRAEATHGIVTKDVNDMLAKAEELAGRGIVMKDDANEAGQLLRGARSMIRQITKHYAPIRKAVKDSISEALKKIDALEDGDLALCTKINELLTEPLKAWMIADKQATETANRRALEEAEARAKREQEEQAAQIRRAAAAAPTVRERQVLERQARQVEKSPVMPVITTVVERTKIEGISTPEGKTAEVVNFKQFIRAISDGKIPEQAVTVNQRWLDEQATARGKDLNFPGVTVREKVGLSAR